MEAKNESKHTPGPALGAIAQLAYRCIQWEDGEIKGYDMQMFESLLPIMVQPLIASAPALLEENEKLKAKQPFLGWTTDKDILNQQREYWGAMNGITELRAEVDHLKNNLLDALDLKQGKGPTALSMLKNEVDRLTKEKSECIEVLKESKKFVQEGHDMLTDTFLQHTQKEFLSCIKSIESLLTRIK